MNSLWIEQGLFDSFGIIFIIMFIIGILMFVFVLSVIISPKLRSKFMRGQLRATKYMLEESQHDLEDLATVAANISVRSNKRILDENENDLKNISKRKANISKDAVEITARAVKAGLTKEVIFCKYCGEKIDDDSVFCKYCGKSQNN
jgi:hypothetical protein